MQKDKVVKKDIQVGVELNQIDNTCKFRLLSAEEYFSYLSKQQVNLSPIYQRPYTYADNSDKWWGNNWQKTLIGDFLMGAFIQPLHLLHRDEDDNNYLYWIIDGGHRTRTLYNFFIGGLLKTQKGLSIE